MEYDSRGECQCEKCQKPPLGKQTRCKHYYEVFLRDKNIYECLDCGWWRKDVAPNDYEQD